MGQYVLHNTSSNTSHPPTQLLRSNFKNDLDVGTVVHVRRIRVGRQIDKKDDGAGDVPSVPHGVLDDAKCVVNGCNVLKYKGDSRHEVRCLLKSVSVYSSIHLDRRCNAHDSCDPIRHIPKSRDDGRAIPAAQEPPIDQDHDHGNERQG